MEFTIELDLSRFNVPEVESREGRVGILTDSPNKKTTNAVIAEANEREYGWITGLGTFVPPRSTIRLPLEMKREEILKRTAESLTEFTQKGIDKAVDEMGQACLDAIQGAFDTGGYGQWERNAPSTIRQKGRDEPMVDEGILRGAYSYEVKK
jgi:hypothetical protein